MEDAIAAKLLQQSGIDDDASSEQTDAEADEAALAWGFALRHAAASPHLTNVGDTPVGAAPRLAAVAGDLCICENW